jgi:DNA-binding FadR family transcriptional regulator
MVWARAGLGTWVAEPSHFAGGEQLVDWFELSDKLPVCELAAKALLELRTTFLLRAAGRAAQDIDAADFEMLEHYVQVMEFHLGRGSLRMTIFEAELSFQQLLVDAVGLALSVGFAPYGKLCRKYLYCFGAVETCPTVPVAAYRSVLEAIRQRQSAAASAALEGVFDDYDRQVVEVLLTEAQRRIDYRHAAGPRVTDWERELDQRDQDRALVGHSHQSPPPWHTPRRDAVHADSPHVLPGATYPHGPLHARGPEPAYEDELTAQYAIGEDNPSEPQKNVENAAAPPTAPPAPGPAAPRAGDPAAPPTGTSTDEREPDG